MNLRKLIMYCSILLFIAISCVNYNTVTYANTMKKEAPENVVVKRNKNKELKIKWSKVKDADGYRIYRYSHKKKKYVKIKTIYNRNKTSWINKELKLHKVYKYKVASFELHKKKKIFSKRSYWVSARTYGNKGKLVNAEQIDIIEDSPIFIGICSETKLQTIILADQQTKNKKARPFSKKMRWSSSDKLLVKVSKQGKLTSFDKEGICYIYVRAHNGKTKKIKVNVINYASPASFPYYEGNNTYINDLLMNYRIEICNIATYFTKYAKTGINGVIKSDEEGNIIGIPQLENILTIRDDLEKLITQFPMVLKIYYSDQGVRFKMNYDASGSSYCDVTYSKWDDCEDSPLKIAPHWTASRSPGN